MSNANHPAAAIAFTELEEAFFRAGELLSEAEPSDDVSTPEPVPRWWGTWQWLRARLR